MPLFEKKISQVFRIVTLCTLWLTVAIGAIMVLFTVKPFWEDEWFIIYNLKTKNVAQLFGPLALMQQFPRAYLALVKLFTESLNYSYSSLRLPSFLVSIAFMALCYKMIDKLFPGRRYVRYLFVMMLVSSLTFTEYYVETKQYTMDMLLSVFVLWQLHRLLRIEEGGRVSLAGYILLCAGFIVVPFFSYTYPIEVAPVFIVVLVSPVLSARRGSTTGPSNPLSKVLLPLFLCACSLGVYYVVEIKQLMADRGMHLFWNFLMVDKNHVFRSFFVSFYTVFAQLGSGEFFEIVFGILGIASFLYGVTVCYKSWTKGTFTIEEKFVLYSCLLLLFTFILFLCNKLPLGTPRLNVFTLPSIAILIINFLDRTSAYIKNDVLKALVPALLLFGLAGNVVTTNANYFCSANYKTQMEIYKATEKAIALAQREKIPMLVTRAVARPYEGAVYSEGVPEQGVWEVKTFPAYDVSHQLPLYPIETMESAKDSIAKLPAGITRVIVGDGVNYRMVSRSGPF